VLRKKPVKKRLRNEKRQNGFKIEVLCNMDFYHRILGGFIFIGFFPFAVLVWGTTFVFGYLFRAAAVIIARLDDIWMAMNPTQGIQVETVQTE